MMISAKEAREMSDLAQHNKAANDLLSPVMAEIKKHAKLGDRRIFIEGKEWHDKNTAAHRLAITKLTDEYFFKVENHIEKFAPNGGRPDDFHGVRVIW